MEEIGKHNNSGNLISINIQKNIDRLTAPFRAHAYKYNDLKEQFELIGERRGIDFPGSKRTPTLQYELYRRVLKRLIFVMGIFCILHSIPIYLFALQGLEVQGITADVASKIYFLITNPYTFVYAAGYDGWLGTFLLPSTTLIIFILFVYELLHYEKDVAETVFRVGGWNLYYSTVLIVKDNNNIKEIVKDALGDKADFVVTECHAYNEIESKIDKLFNLNIEVATLEAKGYNSYRAATHKQVILEEIKALSVRFKENTSSMITKKVIVSFYSYEENFRFFRIMTGALKADMKSNISEIITHPAPSAEDIDWDAYTMVWDLLDYTFVVFLALVYFGLLPAGTFYVEKVLSRTIAEEYIKMRSSIETMLPSAYVFIWVRVGISSAFSVLCTKSIEFIFGTRKFATYSSMTWSFFTFYNFYYLLNQVIADFYGLISWSISDFDTKGSKEVLVFYGYYLFISALKVGVLLAILPYCLKVLNFIPRFLKRTMMYLPWRKSLMLERVIADIPPLHQFPEMASFVTQCFFFVSFFQAFMFPLLGGMIFGALIIFYHFEGFFVNRWEARRKALAPESIKMIYIVCLSGFLLAQPFSLGNTGLVLKYYNNPSIDSATALLMSVTNYSTLLLLILANFGVLYYFSESRSHARILASLSKHKDSETVVQARFEPSDNPYRWGNPLHKAKRGYYNKLIEKDNSTFM